MKAHTLIRVSLLLLSLFLLTSCTKTVEVRPADYDAIEYGEAYRITTKSGRQIETNYAKMTPTAVEIHYPLHKRGPEAIPLEDVASIERVTLRPVVTTVTLMAVGAVIFFGYMVSNIGVSQ